MEIYDNLSVESLPNEEWRDIVGYEGKYKISNMGRLFLCGVYRDGRRYKPHIKKTSLDVGGYEYANLTDFDGNVKTYKIHRLVAMAFIENPNNFPCIDHINRIRTDNRIENLRWCTKEENNRNTKRSLPDGKQKHQVDVKEYNRETVKRYRHKAGISVRYYNK